MTRQVDAVIDRFIECDRLAVAVSLVFCRLTLSGSMDDPRNDDHSPFDDLFAPVEKIFAEFDRIFLDYPSLFTVPPPDESQDQSSRSSASNLRDEVLKQDQPGKQMDHVKSQTSMNKLLSRQSN